MGLRHARDLGSQAPPLFLVYVEKNGEPGDKANNLYQSNLVTSVSMNGGSLPEK